MAMKYGGIRPYSMPWSHIHGNLNNKGGKADGKDAEDKDVTTTNATDARTVMIARSAR